MKLNYLWTLFVLLSYNIAIAQTPQPILSQLIDQTGTPIIAAWVSVNHSSLKVQSDENGKFELNTTS